MKFYRFFFLILGVSFALPVYAQEALNAAFLETAQNRTVLQGSSWAAAAAYTDGTLLAGIEPDLRLAPASTLKLVTSAAALEAFGPFYRFETSIYADALPDEQGVLHGNLYIRGGGDPTLGSARVTGSLAWDKLLENWSSRLKQAGIRQIDGRIYADTSLFSGPSVPDKFNWQNMGNYFAAPTTALAFNDNQFSITFSPQSKHGEKLEIEAVSPKPEGLVLHSFVTADSQNPKDNAYVYGAPYQYEMSIYGTLPTSVLKKYSIRAALPQAPKTLAELLQKQLQQDGISVRLPSEVLYTAPTYTDKHLVFTHYSAPLKDIIYILNKRSFNFYAEVMLRHLALQAGQAGTIQNGIDALHQFLKRAYISDQNVLVYDGSGLSRDNQITVRVLLDVLLYMSKQPNFQYYYESLATLEDRGDLLLLTRLMKPLKRTKDVHVKGGTIDGVKAQAGYAKDKNGQLIAFAFITNNIIAQDESINRFYEELLKLLLEYPTSN